MLKILVINKFLYRKGGDALVTLDTAELLRSKGHEVALWGMKHSANPVYPYQESFVSGVDYSDNVDFISKLKASFNILYSLEAKDKIENVIKEFKPAIAHLHNYAHQISPSILHSLKKYGIPIVMTLHDYKMVCASYSMLAGGKICKACRNGKYYQCFFKKCVKNSRAKSLLSMIEMYLHHKVLRIYDLVDIFISPSAFLKNKLIEMGFRGYIIHLPNFLMINGYSPEFGWRNKNIVYLGRLSKEKGLFTLLDAMKEVKDIGLEIVGDGPIRTQLENKAAAEGITNIRFLGYKSDKDIRGIVGSAIFAVLPSECYENNPRSIIEAFALGKPVIGSGLGGIPELVKNGRTGLIFNAGDSHDLAEKIKDLLRDKEKIVEMGKNARKFAEEELGPERHYSSLMDIYNMALKR